MLYVLRFLGVAVVVVVCAAIAQPSHINGNPVARPAEIRNVTLVFKEGVGYDAPKLIESIKGLVGLR